MDNVDTNRTRLVRKAKPVDSFFNFFSPPTPPAEDAIESGDLDEEELESIEERLEVDYQIGEDLKEKVSLLGETYMHYAILTTLPWQIIPHAVDWFTGAALEFEGYDDDDDDFEDLDDDDDDDEDRFEDVRASFSSAQTRILKVTDC